MEKGTTLSEREYFFTWGTLKKNFLNHEKYKHVLDDFVGEFSSAPLYNLIVPYDLFCPNDGCQFIHRIGALTKQIEGCGANIQGEVYRVTKEGLSELDKLENYIPGRPKDSTYIREQVDVMNKDGQTVSAHVYFIADDGPYKDLLECKKAGYEETYTKEMNDQGTKKECCAYGLKHPGKHDVMQIPTCEY